MRALESGAGLAYASRVEISLPVKAQASLSMRDPKLTFWARAWSRREMGLVKITEFERRQIVAVRNEVDQE
jgi:hypothetical protein